MSLEANIFLAIVALGYAAFMVTLLWVYVYVNLPERSPRRVSSSTPARYPSA